MNERIHFFINYCLVYFFLVGLSVVCADEWLWRENGAKLVEIACS